MICQNLIKPKTDNFPKENQSNIPPYTPYMTTINILKYCIFKKKLIHLFKSGLYS